MKLSISILMLALSFAGTAKAGHLAQVGKQAGDATENKYVRTVWDDDYRYDPTADDVQETINEFMITEVLTPSTYSYYWNGDGNYFESSPFTTTIWDVYYEQLSKDGTCEKYPVTAQHKPAMHDDVDIPTDQAAYTWNPVPGYVDTTCTYFYEEYENGNLIDWFSAQGYQYFQRPVWVAKGHASVKTERDYIKLDPARVEIVKLDTDTSETYTYNTSVHVFFLKPVPVTATCFLEAGYCVEWGTAMSVGGLSLAAPNNDVLDVIQYNFLLNPEHVTDFYLVPDIGNRPLTPKQEFPAPLSAYPYPYDRNARTLYNDVYQLGWKNYTGHMEQNP